MGLQTDLRQYLAILWHWAWLLLLVALLGGGLSYYLSDRQPRIYQSSTTIMVDEGKTNTDYQSILTSERKAKTYSQLMTADPLLGAIKDKLGLPFGTAALKSMITVTPARDTQLITVLVRDTDAGRAAQIANTLVQVFAEQTQQMQAGRYATTEQSLQAQMAELNRQIQETQANIDALGDDPKNQASRERLDSTLAQYRQSYNNLYISYAQLQVSRAQSNATMVQVEPAVAATLPISPRVRRSTALGALLGLLLAAGLVFLKETLDDSVKQPEALGEALGLPVLGLIAHMSRTDKIKPIVAMQPRSPISEAFRSLRTNLLFTSVDKPLHTLLITSPTPGEGKSETSVNIAIAMAQSGQRVTLIDADLRRPVIHNRLSLTNRGGLSDLFVQPVPQLDGVMRNTGIQNLALITAGTVPPNPAELVGSEKMVEILRQAQAHADILVIDTPPVMPVTDAVVLAQRVDGVLLVVRAGQTKLAVAKRAVEQLQRVGANVVGVVINDLPQRRGRYGYGYQGYYSRYDDNTHGGGGGSGLGKLLRRKKKPQPQVDAS